MLALNAHKITFTVRSRFKIERITVNKLNLALDLVVIQIVTIFSKYHLVSIILIGFILVSIILGDMLIESKVRLGCYIVITSYKSPIQPGRGILVLKKEKISYDI